MCDTANMTRPVTPGVSTGDGQEQAASDKRLCAFTGACRSQTQEVVSYLPRLWPQPKWAKPTHSSIPMYRS